MPRINIPGITIRLSSVFSYTPNRYVDTAASGGGDGTIGDPWTPAEALAVSGANAGDTCKWIGAVATGTSTATTTLPAFRSGNSGASGSPIIHYTEVGLELRNGVTTDSTGCPTFGCNGEDYIIWDGFYVNENVSASRPDTGPVIIADSTGSELRRCKIEGDLGVLAEDNHPGVRLEAANNITVTDCEIFNMVGAHRVDSAPGIEVYSCYELIIKYNDFHDCDGGVYIKNEAVWDQANHTIDIYLNHVYDCRYGVQIKDANEGFGTGTTGSYGCHVYQNIFSGGDYYGGVYIRQTNGTNVIANNLIVNYTAGGDSYVSGFSDSNATPTSCVLRNNLIIDTVWGVGSQDGGSWASGIDSDDNMFDGQTTNLGHIAGTSYTLAAWRTLTGDETNSEESDPLFTNKAGGDYTLDTGSPALDAGTDYLNLLGGGTSATINYGPYISSGQTETIGIRANPSY